MPGNDRFHDGFVIAFKVRQYGARQRGGIIRLNHVPGLPFNHGFWQGTNVGNDYRAMVTVGELDHATTCG